MTEPTLAQLLPWQLNALLTGLVLGGVLILRWLILRGVRVRVDDARMRYRLRGITTYTLLAFAAVSVGAIWLEGLQGDQLATYFGFATAGAAIALRDPIVNLVAWLYITFMRPFRVGDRIEVRGQKGDVVGQDAFSFKMLELGNWVLSDQSTGRVISMPNAVVFLEPVINYTQEFAYLWLEIPVVVTFESRWREMRELLLELGTKHTGAIVDQAERALRASSRLMVDYGTLTPIVYTTAVDHGVQMTLRCLVGARGRRVIEDAIWRDLLAHFEEHPSVELAYPTQRFFDRRMEQGEGEGAGVGNGEGRTATKESSDTVG